MARTVPTWQGLGGMTLCPCGWAESLPGPTLRSGLANLRHRDDWSCNTCGSETFRFNLLRMLHGRAISKLHWLGCGVRPPSGWAHRRPGQCRYSSRGASNLNRKHACVPIGACCTVPRDKGMHVRELNEFKAGMMMSRKGGMARKVMPVAWRLCQVALTLVVTHE